MSKSSVRVLPVGPSLDHLKKEAKRLQVALKEKQPQTKLALAQLQLARDYGFSSWRALKAHVEASVVTEEAAKAFLKAVGDGDAALVRAMIQKDKRLVNAPGPHPFWGGCPQGLHVAVEKGHGALFELLLEAGADIEGDNRQYGWSPLWLAVHWKRDAMVKELIRRGARVGFVEAVMLGDDAKVEAEILRDPKVVHGEMPGGKGATPLHFVRTVRAARLLLDAGVPVGARDGYGKTAAEAVAAREPMNAQLLALLEGAGASVHPGVYASIGDLAALKKAVKKDPGLLKGVYPFGTFEVPLIHIAVEKGHAGVVKWLLAQGEEVDRVNKHGATPLHTAAWNGQVEIARLLVAGGANVEAKDGEHQSSPAVWARTCAKMLNRPGCVEVAEYLEALAGKPATQDKGGKKMAKKVTMADWKPIMDAAYVGDAQKIKKLLKEGADPNVLSTTNHRHRPLHRAAERKKTFQRTEAHDAGVRALLEGGADPSMRAGYDSLTALALAATGEIRFVPILMEKFRPDDIFHACVLGDEARVKAILKKAPTQAQAVDENGWSALHYCTNSGMFLKGKKEEAALVGIARMLIEKGADPMATYRFEEKWPIPPLYGCCGKHDNPSVARVLFEAGATPYDNETVYHATDEEHEGCLKLIEEFADKQKLAAECSRCLVTQLHWNHQRGMAWLLAHGADPTWPSPETGETALHKAARNGANKETLALLLKHGARVDAKDKKGQTPVDLARAAGKARVVQELQGAKAKG